MIREPVAIVFFREEDRNLLLESLKPETKIGQAERTVRFVLIILVEPRDFVFDFWRRVWWLKCSPYNPRGVLCTKPVRVGAGPEVVLVRVEPRRARNRVIRIHVVVVHLVAHSSPTIAAVPIHRFFPFFPSRIPKNLET